MSTTPTASADPRPTFYGTLELHRGRDGVSLTLTFHCPACQRLHHHSWGFDPAQPPPKTFPVEPTHRQAHCTASSSPYRGPCRGYFIFPEQSEANSRVLEQFQAEAEREVAEGRSGMPAGPRPATPNHVGPAGIRLHLAQAHPPATLSTGSVVSRA